MIYWLLPLLCFSMLNKAGAKFHSFFFHSFSLNILKIFIAQNS